MVKVEILYRGNEIRGFTVKGHAGYATEGKDIYCAGVSAISQTALLGLLNNLSQEPEYKVEKGFLEVKLPALLDYSELEKAQLILNTMELGLNSMAQAYPQFIRVDTRRC